MKLLNLISLIFISFHGLIFWYGMHSIVNAENLDSFGFWSVFYSVFVTIDHIKNK